MLPQWPEDFNFDVTRAINSPTLVDELSSASPKPASVDMDENEKRDSVSAEVMSVRIPEEDDELDPANLQKAFRFAAWSSVILVSVH